MKLRGCEIERSVCMFVSGCEIEMSVKLRGVCEIDRSMCMFVLLIPGSLGLAVLMARCHHVF